MSVEGPKVVKRKESHLDTVALIDRLRAGQKVVVWDDFASNSMKPMWLRRGDIGQVQSIDGDGAALITFFGKDRQGRSLSTIVNRSNWQNLRMEIEGAERKRPKMDPKRTETVASRAACTVPKIAAGSSQIKEKQDEQAEMTPEEREKNRIAQERLEKNPKKGVVRFTFTEEGPLGLRFSKDVPPWILSVANVSPAARKAPKVPVAGIVLAVNGHEITEQDSDNVMQGLKKRPVVLDIDWPVDQELPVVCRA